MIGSFWNFCKACPAMPTDKFRSEYRSTYRWHEFQSRILNSTMTAAAGAGAGAGADTIGPVAQTGSSSKHVIRKPPQLNPAVSQHIHFAANQVVPVDQNNSGADEEMENSNENYTNVSKIAGPCTQQPQQSVSVTTTATPATAAAAAAATMNTQNPPTITNTTTNNNNTNNNSSNTNFNGSLAQSNIFACKDLPATETFTDSDLWFKDVLELRKKAEEYKYRGWGTELASENIISIYNKQLELWNQVSERSSLSALSLASTLPKKILDGNHRSTVAAVAINESNHSDKINEKNVFEGLNFSAGTREKLEPVTIFNRHSLLDNYQQQQQQQQHHHQQQQRKKDHTKVGPKIMKSKKFLNKSPRSHSAGPLSNLNRSPKARNSLKPKSSDKTIYENGDSSAIGDNVVAAATAEEPDDTKTDESDGICLLKIVPEPTRVKSPEQILVKSPEPVNWTVPLEQTKTFIVTQSII